MSGKEQFIIMTGEELELFTFCTQLSELKLSWMAIDKTPKPLAQLKDNYFVLFHVGRNPQDDQDVLKKLKANFPQLPIIAIVTADNEISGAAAQLTDAILKLPANNDVIQTKLMKFTHPSTKKDSRIYQRTTKELEISWTLNARKAQETVTGNISAGGAFVTVSSSAPHPGDVIKFNLKSPEQKIINGEGIVRWVGKNGFGMEFLSFNLKPID